MCCICWRCVYLSDCFLPWLLVDRLINRIDSLIDWWVRRSGTRVALPPCKMLARFQPENKNIGTQCAQSRWSFASQYGEIYHDNLWVLHLHSVPPYPSTPPPPLSKKNRHLWLANIKPGNKQRDYVTVNYSVTLKLRFPFLQRQQKQQVNSLKLTHEKYCIDN